MNWLDFELIKTIAAFGGFILGLCTFLYNVYKDFLIRPLICGKLISIYGSEEEASVPYRVSTFNEELKGRPCLLKFSVLSLNKSFSVKTVNIYVSYPNNGKKYIKGEIVWTEEATFSFYGIKCMLSVPISENIAYLNLLEKDKVNVGYIMFFIEEKDYQFLTEAKNIKITFTNYKNRQESLNFKVSEVEPKTLIFDSRIWKQINIRN